MDTKWIPAAPLPDWKSWSTRSKELSGFKGWLDKFASCLCLVHDSYTQELKEALNLPYSVVIVNQDQAIRSRRLFHLLQQSFSGYSRVDNVVKSQIAFYGIQEAIAAQGVQFDEPSRGAAIQRSLPEVHCEEVREASSHECAERDWG